MHIYILNYIVKIFDTCNIILKKNQQFAKFEQDIDRVVKKEKKKKKSKPSFKHPLKHIICSRPNCRFERGAYIPRT